LHKKAGTQWQTCHWVPAVVRGVELGDAFEIAVFKLGGLIFNLTLKASNEANNGIKEEGDTSEREASDGYADPVCTQVTNRETGPEIDVCDPRECNAQHKLNEWFKFSGSGVGSLAQQAQRVDP